MRRLLRRLEKLEASPAATAARSCPGCWGITIVHCYEGDPEPPYVPCPVCNDTNPPPRDGGINRINVHLSASSRPPRGEAEQEGQRKDATPGATEEDDRT